MAEIDIQTGSGSLIDGDTGDPYEVPSITGAAQVTSALTRTSFEVSLHTKSYRARLKPPASASVLSLGWYFERRRHARAAARSPARVPVPLPAVTWRPQRHAGVLRRASALRSETSRWSRPG
jgi:hypothetical protein